VATLNECGEVLRSVPSATSDKETIIQALYRVECVMSETFSFLDLNLPSDVRELITTRVWTNPNERHRLQGYDYGY
jgi:hypothetical protein